MGKLSVVISAFNEEGKIKECLESVCQLADEIIFVDNSSTDKTADIAREYTSKIFTRPNNPMLNINKNFGFRQATGNWVLSLDADERVTPELREEMEAKIRNSEVDGYWIPRKNIIFGRWIKHTGWYPDHQLRLFRRGKGKFPEVHVHEMIVLGGKTEYLKGYLEHLNYGTISQFLLKLMNIYGPNEAQVLIKKGYKFNWVDVIKMPTREFINRFFAQKGYKDGLHGLVLSLLMAFYHLVVFVQIWERKNFQEVKEASLSGTVVEAKKALAELRFWYLTVRIEEARNVIKKLLLKVQRKFL